MLCLFSTSTDAPALSSSTPSIRRRALVATAGLLLLGSSVTAGTIQAPLAAPPEASASKAGSSSEASLPNRTVGSLRLFAPQLKTFVLHGTLPLPPKTFVPGANAIRFVLRGSDGQVWSAQTNVVSRYANLLDGADVIELIAMVTRPDNLGPGAELRFEVLPRGAAQHGGVSLNRTTSRLIRTPGSISLRTRDVFGNPYGADLLKDLRKQTPELRTLKSGRIAAQYRTHENLTPTPPVEGTEGTLPHLMGVHSYVTVWGGLDIISLDLRFHNGHEGRLDNTLQDDPMGTLYFDGLALSIPEGWKALHAYSSPNLGAVSSVGNREVTPLVEGLPDNKLHVMHPQAQFHRRIVLCREGSENLALVMVREAGLAFCEDGTNQAGERYYSWWNPRTSRYFAQDLPLPDLSYLESQEQSRLELSGKFNAMHSLLSTGQSNPWPIVAPLMGWAQPYGDPSGGAPGGSGIFFFEGVKTAWSASVDGYRRMQVIHRMYTDRQKTAFYQGSGDAYRMDNWIEMGPNGPYFPNYIWLNPWLPLGDPYGFLSAPDFHVNAVLAQGRQPDYDVEFEDYNPVDSSHLIRYTRFAKVLAWLGNDAIAKDDLLMHGELCRASYTILPQTASGESITTGLLADLEYVQQNPQDGFKLDRAQGWMIDTAAVAYALDTPARRTEVRPWFNDVVDLMLLGQSNCFGNIMSYPFYNHFDGQYRVLQSISECILQNAMWGAKSTVYEGLVPNRVRDVNRIVQRSAYSMINELVWKPGDSAAHFYTALGPFDQTLPSFCNYVPEGGYSSFDGWQIWNMLTFGFKLTGDVRFLQRAADASGGVLSLEGMGMDQFSGELETRAGMISLMQAELGY